MTPTDQNTDNDLHKGAMEDEKFGEPAMTSMNGQLGHRDQDPLLKSADSDFPEPGENAEHNGEYKEPNQKDQDTHYIVTGSPEGKTQDQDPGERQKENQNKKKDDELAA